MRHEKGQRERRKISRTKFKFFKLKIENLATRFGYSIIMESKINLITWYNKYYWYDKTDSTIENKLPNNTRILYTTFAYYHTTQRDTKLNTNESKKEKRGEEGTVTVKYSYKDNSPVYSSLHCRAAINVAILSGNYSTHRRNTRSNHPATLIRNSNMSSSLSLSLPLHCAIVERA